MISFKNKKGLGRGLSSLIGDNDIKSSKNNISISSIVPNRNQPRKLFEKESLNELTNSIKERGIIQPLIVRKSVDQDKMFELIAGERRWQAAQAAGMHEVPVLIVDADHLKSLELAIIENVQRRDLNAIEEAESYKNLIENFENHIDPKDPTNNCLDVAIITAPEKRTQKTKDKLKTVAGRILLKK